MFQKRSVKKINTHILRSILSSENRAIYEAMWNNMAHPDMPQMTVQYGECTLNAPYYTIMYGYKHKFRIRIMLFRGKNGCMEASLCCIYTYIASLV